MSNIEVNNTGMNCTKDANGKVCKISNSKENTLNNQEEFASEFDSNNTSNQNYNSRNTFSKMFKPNKQNHPVSERTAWN
ncbi:hypothetical protein MTP04_38620 [Lysinibacillus sp. PLM2]|nr:hypothetical protein MTP04_38620 [Lysinibacillus sp. PLM2]